MVTKQHILPERLFDALGHQTRRDILRLLAARPRAVGELADRLPVSRPAVSKHLKLLRETGLVQYEEDGTRNVFRIDSTGFSTARDALDAFWTAALSNFEQLVRREGRHG